MSNSGMNTEDKDREGNSYRSILKGASIFGGVQVFQTLINLVRGKFVAVLLGPEGMGIASLFASASTTIQKFSSLGLNLSIVRETAAAGEEPERIIGVARRMTTVTAILGFLICAVFAVPLSRLTFGDEGMAWQFVLLGVAVGFGISGTGLLSILQGRHEVKRLSRASIVGGVTGLVAGVPLYWAFGTRGIVPAMCVLSFAMYLFYHLTLRKAVGRRQSRFAWRSHLPEVRRLATLGLVLMAGDIVGTVVGYAINLFIRSYGSLDDVGLYQAANSITSQYSGIVFAIMAMDYFPRLTKVAGDDRLMGETVNRQTEMTSLLIAPASSLLILTAPLVIRILLDEKFLPTLGLMRWMGLGIMFRALMMPMAYITFAKGNKRVFFWLEGMTGNFLTLTLSCVFFRCFGLDGLGYALVVDNGLCILIYYAVNRRLYGLRLSRQTLLLMCGTAILTGGCFLGSLAGDGVMSVVLMSVFTIASLLWSWKAIRQRLRRQ